tara:strand:+ start:157 stop:1938 length:1782 start_codon:yes stop_codon:yes gene_type:complete
MSEKETVLECRQLSSKKVFTNGDFETVLENNNVVIEEGDSLVLKKAVIDSIQTQNEELLIENDTLTTINFYRYFVNWKCKKNGSSITQSLYTLDRADVAPDNKMYFEAQLTTNVNPIPNIRLLDEIKFTKNPRLNSGKWGNCVVSFSYRTTSGHNSVYTVNIPQLDCNEFITYSVYPKIIFERTTLFLTTSTSYIQNNGILNNIETLNSEFTASKVFDLVPASVSFTISKGRYTCDEICQIINSNVDKSANNLQDLEGSRYNNTPLLGSTADSSTATLKLLSTGNADLIVEGDNPVVNVMTTLTTAGLPSQYTGSSDFSIAYDGNKFKIETMNSVYYTNKSTTPANRGLTGVLYNLKGTATDATAVKNIINKSSGIVLSALQPEELWYDKLGFDGSVCPPLSTGTVKLATEDIISHLFANTLKDGIHITGTAPTLDASIIKSVADNADHTAFTFNCIPKNDVNTDLEIQASGQIEIYANNTYNYSILKTYGGYMLLEIRLGLNQDYTGEQNHLKNVFGIITNYYRSNNYIVATSEDGCLYNHIGNSVQINSVRVRLLNPNTLEPVVGLDQDNSVFLSLIKNQAPKNLNPQKKK